MPCYKKYKEFLIYSRLSNKEGLFTETTIKDQDIRFGKYNKDLQRECEWCYQVFEIEKAFKENEYMCNECYKLLQKEKIREVISPKIYIIYNENQEYRICTNIDRYFAEYIFRKENIKDKAGTVSGETLGIYLNSKTS